VTGPQLLLAGLMLAASIDRPGREVAARVA
jgi:hypothetical protein